MITVTATDKDVPTQTISQDTTWDAEGSPYRVLGDVTVIGGKRLTIGPDATVVISATHAITADGAVVEVFDSTITSGTLAVTNSSSSAVEFNGNVALCDVAWRDPGAGRFKILGKSVWLFGDGIPQGHNLLVNDGSDEKKPKNTMVKQGYVENTNINVVTEMVNMIELNRLYETFQRIITTIDGTTEKLIDTVGRGV